MTLINVGLGSSRAERTVDSEALLASRLQSFTASQAATAVAQGVGLGLKT